MRLLIWHWGRFGAGPRYAAALADSLRAVGIDALLSLPDGAEILHGAGAPRCDLPVRTYAGVAGFAGRVVTAPLAVGGLARRLRRLRVDAALCAMPAMLDLLMLAALRRIGVPVAVVVHDAEPHPGERVPLQHRLQRRLLRRADVLVALSGHVAARLRGLGLAEGRALLTASLPPLDYGAVPPRTAHGGLPRLLLFGRLLPYKGLDLFAEALAQLGPVPRFEVRVVGQGPESEVLAALRGRPGVRVENRWVPEDEVAALLGWADALVLSHREASQSGVAAVALAAQRPVVATGVGGLVEQLGGETLALLCAPEAGRLAAALAELEAGLAGGRWAAGGGDPGQAWAGMAARLGPELRAAFDAVRSGQGW